MRPKGRLTKREERIWLDGVYKGVKMCNRVLKKSPIGKAFGLEINTKSKKEVIKLAKL